MIYGCDLGSRRAAIVCPETQKVAVLRLPPRKRIDQVLADDDARAIAYFIRTTVCPTGTLWIEKAIVGASGNRQTAIHMGIANGAVLGSHLGPGYLVLPMVWKKAVVGHGHADKSAIAIWLRAHHPALAEACQDDEDLIDAACVGLYGVAAAESALEATGPLCERTQPRSVLRKRRQSANGKSRGGRGKKAVPAVSGSA